MKGMLATFMLIISMVFVTTLSFSDNPDNIMIFDTYSLTDMSYDMASSNVVKDMAKVTIEGAGAVTKGIYKTIVDVANVPEVHVDRLFNVTTSLTGFNSGFNGFIDGVVKFFISNL